MKLILKKFIIASFFLFFLIPQVGQAAGDTIYFFYSQTCPHCAKQELFMKKWQKQDKSLDIQSFEVSSSRTNAALLGEIGGKLGVKVRGVPFTVVGNRYIEGYLNNQTSGAEIERYVEECRSFNCSDIVGEIIQTKNNIGESREHKSVETMQLLDSIVLPWLGEINWRTWSLPAFTVLIAALDGFNPCAMWVLIFLIGLLLGMKNKKRMWILGITFLVVSAGVYFIFMAAWLNLLLFLGLVVWIRIFIALVALIGGGFNIRQWWRNKTGACKVTGSKKRQKLFTRLKKIVQEKNFFLAILGIVVLAFLVNLVELVCSAGLPAVYTQVLTLSNLASWQYYLYLLFYIFIFLLDDIIVFSIAMLTLQLTGLSTKYSRYSNLIGGILMVIIGVLLILKPEWLMFG